MRPIKRSTFERVGLKFKNESLLYYAEDLTDFNENKDKVQRTKTINPNMLFNDSYIVIIEDLIVEGFFYLEEKKEFYDWLAHTEIRDKKTFLILPLSLTLSHNTLEKIQSKKPNYYCTVTILVGSRDKKVPISFTQIIGIQFFDTPQKKRKQPKFEELEANKLNWGKLQPIPIRN